MFSCTLRILLTKIKVNVKTYLFFYCYFQNYLYFCKRTIQYKTKQKVKNYESNILSRHGVVSCIINGDEPGVFFAKLL